MLFDYSELVKICDFVLVVDEKKKLQIYIESRYMNSLFMFEFNRPMTKDNGMTHHINHRIIFRRDNHKQGAMLLPKKIAENINFARMKRRDFDRDLIVAG